MSFLNFFSSSSVLMPKLGVLHSGGGRTTNDKVSPQWGSATGSQPSWQAGAPFRPKEWARHPCKRGFDGTQGAKAAPLQATRGTQGDQNKRKEWPGRRKSTTQQPRQWRGAPPSCRPPASSSARASTPVAPAQRTIPACQRASAAPPAPAGCRSRRRRRRPAPSALSTSSTLRGRRPTWARTRRARTRRPRAPCCTATAAAAAASGRARGTAGASEAATAPVAGAVAEAGASVSGEESARPAPAPSAAAAATLSRDCCCSLLH